MNIIKGGLFHFPNGKTLKNAMLIYENGKISYIGTQDETINRYLKNKQLLSESGVFDLLNRDNKFFKKIIFKKIELIGKNGLSDNLLLIIVFVVSSIIIY